MAILYCNKELRHVSREAVRGRVVRRYLFMSSVVQQDPSETRNSRVYWIKLNATTFWIHCPLLPQGGQRSAGSTGLYYTCRRNYSNNISLFCVIFVGNLWNLDSKGNKAFVIPLQTEQFVSRLRIDVIVSCRMRRWKGDNEKFLWSGVVILTNPPYLGLPRTILIVVSGTHFSINVDFFWQLNYFKSINVWHMSILN